MQKSDQQAPPRSQCYGDLQSKWDKCSCCAYMYIYTLYMYMLCYGIEQQSGKRLGTSALTHFVAVQSILFHNKQNSTSVHMCIVYYRIHVEMFHFKVTVLQHFFSTNLYCFYRKSILPTPYIPLCKKLGFKLRNRLLLIVR